MQGIHTYLRDFRQVNIAGMNVQNHLGAPQILYDARRQILRHISLDIPRKQPVHIHLKRRNPAGNGVNPQRVHRRIDIHNSFQVLLLRIDAPD